jgi:hypothetical protein
VHYRKDKVKRYPTTALIALCLLLPAASASAWWQWFYQDIPYAPVPGMWLYQNIPQSGVPGQIQPWFWQYQSLPTGPPTMWTSGTPMSSLFIEQSQSPMGYGIRIHTGGPGTQDIQVGLEGRALVIRKRETTGTVPGVPIQMQQSGWSTQWVSLPGDANLAAMRMSRGNGLVEIFVPRTH